MGASNKSSSVVEGAADKVDGGYELPRMSKLGGTENDEHEMRMLGKTQQLNVSPNNSDRCYTGWSLTFCRETSASSRRWVLLAR